MVLGDAREALDVGGADVNGGYRPIFDDPRYRYLTVDLAAGEGVDVVLDDPYRLPFADGSVDIVLSGQMLEHCEFFWLTFAEMMRVPRFPTGRARLHVPVDVRPVGIPSVPLHDREAVIGRLLADTHYATKDDIVDLAAQGVALLLLLVLPMLP